MTLIATSSPVNKCFALLTIANLPLREILMILLLLANPLLTSLEYFGVQKYKKKVAYYRRIDVEQI